MHSLQKEGVLQAVVNRCFVPVIRFVLKLRPLKYKAVYFFLSCGTHNLAVEAVDINRENFIENIVRTLPIRGYSTLRKHIPYRITGLVEPYNSSRALLNNIVSNYIMSSFVV